VRLTFSERSLRQRIIALAAAYALALAGLIASFGLGEAVAATALAPADASLCHSTTGEQPKPATDQNSACIECCIGCLAMAATLAPPSAVPAAPRAFGHRHVSLTRFVLAGGACANAHRSRGPPSTL
jgi:hypothetical protein